MPGSGRRPANIIKPIFRLEAWAQPALQTTTAKENSDPGNISQKQELPVVTTTIPSTQKTNASTLPYSTPIKIKQLGPSIRNVQTTDNSKVEEKIKEATSVENKPFTQEEIIHQWHAYVERMPKERRAMAMRMKGMTPRLINESTFEIVANNPQIAQYLLNMKDNILKELRSFLCNARIQMSVRIAEVQELQHITSKPALYQKMAEKNANIQKLTDLLKLEIC